MVKYTFLSKYTNDGYPLKINLDENNANIKETINQKIIDEIDNELSESSKNGGVTSNHSDWIKKSDIVTSNQCEIKLTFIKEGAGYKNALSYYIYDLDDPPTRFSDINDVYIIFPNASSLNSGGKMVAGDTMKLVFNVTSHTKVNGNMYADTVDYKFPANVGISFVVHSNQWKSGGSSGTGNLAMGHLMYSSDPILNPEHDPDLKQHFVNFRSYADPSKVIYGVEDIRRDRSWCDHDFNDLCFYVTPTPTNAFDEYCYNSTVKQRFKGTILCEDLLNRPNADLDYDDLCLEYFVTENIIGTKIYSISIKVKGIARGATLNHEFGVVIPHIKNVNVKIINETYIAETDTSKLTHMTHDIMAIGSDKVPIIRNTSTFLPAGQTWATNTVLGEVKTACSYAVTRMLFPDGIDRSELSNVKFPYNFYLSVSRGTKHLWDLFSNMSYSDVSISSKQSGILTKKKIIIIENVVNIQVPIEKQPLRKVYYKMQNFLLGDIRYQAWYLKKWAKNNLLFPLTISTDTHLYNTLLDDSNLPLRGNMIILPNDISLPWGGPAISGICQMHKILITDLLDWNSIVEFSDINNLIELVNVFGNLHILVDNTYENNTGLYYYVSTTSKQLNTSRVIHNKVNGTNDTLELLSSASRYKLACFRA